MIELRETGTGRVLASGENVFVRAAAVLDSGGIVIHPTSTVYGIGGRPRPAVDAEITRLKGRSAASRLIRVASGVDELRRALPRLSWPTGAERLAEEFWPGPLTLVLAVMKKDGSGEDELENTVAVRVDPHPVLNRTLSVSGGVMTSTSLNVTGEPPARTQADLAAAIEALGPSRISMTVMDAGDLPVARPTTVVGVSCSGVRLIREGDVSWPDILSVVSGGEGHHPQTGEGR